MDRVLNQFGGVLQVELFLDVRPVRFDRFNAQVKFLRNLPGCASLPNERKHFQFAITQILQR